MRPDSEQATTSADLRAHNLARLLRAVHDGGGERTRAELTRQLSLARGTATVLVRDLADRGLIEELQVQGDMAERRSRGRPTGVPSPHPDGPVALAVDLRDDSFSLASFELTGRGTMLERCERAARSGAVLPATVEVYTLEVAIQMKKWPERKQRRLEWMDVPTAAGLVNEPGLSVLMRRLGELRQA